jgi:hypothetical protein
MPGRLAERYLAAMANDDLDSHRSDLALLEARLGELLGRLKSACGASLTTYQTSLDHLESLRKAFYDGDDMAFTKSLDLLRSSLRSGRKAENTWREIDKTISQRTVVAAAEQKRQFQLGTAVPAEEVVQLLRYVGAVIRGAVTDETVLTNIEAGIRRAVLLPEDRSRGLPPKTVVDAGTNGVPA